MKIYKTKDYDSMSLKAASIIASQVVLKPDCVLGLATGSSPIGLYKELIARCEKGELDFSAVKTVNLDEYVGLAPDHDQCYRFFMNTNLFDHINIDKANTNVPDGLAADPDAESARYDAVIDSMGQIDIQLLGMGHNGHIGFNEPDDYFPMGTHAVDLQESTINANARFFESIDDVPRQALTMGIGSIMKAKSILVVVSGEGKADIVAKAFGGPVTPNVPASILQMHPDVTLVGDEAALSKLLG
ncbi:MAG: glucosamine-6-phosphate deaminase [Clostridia bacterium]|nr:glucosamine-6-phosphate deaminase [Clostridia bacterium]